MISTATLSLIFGYVATALSIIGFQLKKQWQIILSQSVSNLMVALSYIVLDISNMAGGIVCLVGALHTFINFLFFRKDRMPPKVIKYIFLLLYLSSAAFTIYLAGKVNFPYDFIPPVASIFFLLGVSTKNPKTTRALFFVNIIFWITYDLLAKPIALANLCTHLLTFASLIAGIIRYDLLKKGTKTADENR